MDSNPATARGKLMFGNHYGQVMLMYRPFGVVAILLILLAEPACKALVARQKAATSETAGACRSSRGRWQVL
jgi:hypothetical protein